MKRPISPVSVIIETNWSSAGPGTPLAVFDLALQVLDYFIFATGVQLPLQSAQRQANDFTKVLRTGSLRIPFCSHLFENLHVISRQVGLVTNWRCRRYDRNRITRRSQRMQECGEKRINQSTVAVHDGDFIGTCGFFQLNFALWFAQVETIYRSLLTGECGI